MNVDVYSIFAESLVRANICRDGSDKDFTLKGDPLVRRTLCKRFSVAFLWLNQNSEEHALFLCPQGSIFQSKLTSSALSASVRRYWISSPAFKTYFKEKSALLSNLLFSSISYRHSHQYCQVQIIFIFPFVDILFRVDPMRRA